MVSFRFGPGLILGMACGFMLGAFAGVQFEVYNRPVVRYSHKPREVVLEHHAIVAQAVTLGVWLGIGAARGQKEFPDPKVIVREVEIQVMAALADVAVFDEPEGATNERRKLVR